MAPPPLPAVMVEPLVRATLLEDLGRAGDITTDAIVPAEARTEMRADGAPERRGRGPRLRRDRIPPDRSGDRMRGRTPRRQPGWHPVT